MRQGVDYATQVVPLEGAQYAPQSLSVLKELLKTLPEAETLGHIRIVKAETLSYDDRMVDVLIAEDLGRLALGVELTQDGSPKLSSSGYVHLECGVCPDHSCQLTVVEIINRFGLENVALKSLEERHILGALKLGLCL